MHVIGTAGHVDHGKSTLVLALTGVDPDRLREEKERGLTIELGFAQLRLPSGESVGVVDVPGHERFIKTMLAGVGGIDLALLVIAADEGVMPQTREHLAIIDLLGIGHGVVALTKADAVDADRLELTATSVREALAGTTLEDAPIVPGSGVTRAGLDDLVREIEAQLAKTPRRLDIGRPRLPVDRVFTMSGFGTVVTGTLTDGSLRVGEEVALLPGDLRARIRGLQNHGEPVEVAEPGTRTAINLAGVAVDDVRRGMVVALPDTVSTVSSFDVRLRAVPYLERAVKHNLPITFHTGASETAGRLLLLEGDALKPGDTAWAQVRLDEPIAALAGDRFIIRDPNDTLGGGTIAAVDAPRHRRNHSPTISALEALARGETPVTEAPVPEPESRPALTPRQRQLADDYVGRLLATPYSPPTEVWRRADILALLIDAGEVVRIRSGIVFAAQAYGEMVSRITERVRDGGPVTLAEVRDMFGTSRRYAQALLEHLDAQKVTRRVGDERVLY